MMRKKKYILLVLISIIAFGIYLRNHIEEAEITEKPFIPAPYITCRYFDEKNFMISVRTAEEVDVNGLEVLGGVTPHHLLADHMIAQFFKGISTDMPKVVILIGPNHQRIGKHKIHTGSWNWQTPFGILESDKNLVDKIVEETDAGEDMDILENDHSIGALIPYIKYYLPESKIVPLVLHGNLGLNNSKELADTILESIGDREYLVIGSVDFSHYLLPHEAEQKDEISIKAIKERDLLAISNMDNDYLDSPPTIITLLDVMNREEALGMKVMDHSNSSKIAGEYIDNTTSYFTLLFYRNDKE